MKSLARVGTLLSYFGLLGFLIAWHGWLEPSKYVDARVVLAFFVIPLLFPLRGLLHGRVYTHQWTPFLTLLYFIHGIGEWAVNPEGRLYSSTEIVLSLALFGFAILYVRQHREPAA